MQKTLSYIESVPVTVGVDPSCSNSGSEEKWMHLKPVQIQSLHVGVVWKFEKLNILRSRWGGRLLQPDLHSPLGLRTLYLRRTIRQNESYFSDGSRHFEPRSSDEETPELLPSPNFPTTSTGGRLSSH
ncbi:hypothetical protein TNCV_994381 [Trichonephila clavipes]|nr:hypothetical protein TNCV_994381 [Trichonephila clavipes]